jgi:hypothetical protein
MKLATLNDRADVSHADPRAHCIQGDLLDAAVLDVSVSGARAEECYR